MQYLCRPIEALLEVEASPHPAATAAAPSGAAADPELYDEGQPLKDEVIMSDAGRPLNIVPSARGADESAKGHLKSQPGLCQLVNLTAQARRLL